MPTTEKPGLTRDAIKYLAIFTMLLNHIANVLLPENTILWEVFIDIGYFTAITMCYFLVEGFYYTHSRRKYGERLLIFAGISQVPYSDSLWEFTAEYDLYSVYLFYESWLFRKG